ncbi:MAG: hypothetical protein V1933_05780 [Candidatus Omnitrophota bacterium]
MFKYKNKRFKAGAGKKKVLISCFCFCVIFSMVSFFRSAEAAFGITLDAYSLSFGSFNPGEIKTDVPEGSIIVTCASDQGNAWNLKIKTEYPLVNSLNPASTIPNANLWWYGVSSTGAGTLITAREDFSSEKTVYSAPAGEGTSGVEIKVKFEISVPKDVQSGQYSSNIIFTIIE